jgi:hypothetical protein
MLRDGSVASFVDRKRALPGIEALCETIASSSSVMGTLIAD